MSRGYLSTTPHQKRTGYHSPHQSRTSHQPPALKAAEHYDDRAVCPICDKTMMDCDGHRDMTLEQLEADYCRRFASAAKYELQAKQDILESVPYVAKRKPQPEKRQQAAAVKRELQAKMELA